MQAPDVQLRDRPLTQISWEPILVVVDGGVLLVTAKGVIQSGNQRRSDGDPEGSVTLLPPLVYLS